MSNAGYPGALAVRAIDGAAATAHRVAAALGTGAAPLRSTSVNTPDRAAANAIRRDSDSPNSGA